MTHDTKRLIANMNAHANHISTFFVVAFMSSHETACVAYWMIKKSRMFPLNLEAQRD